MSSHGLVTFWWCLPQSRNVCRHLHHEMVLIVAQYAIPRDIIVHIHGTILSQCTLLAPIQNQPWSAIRSLGPHWNQFSSSSRLCTFISVLTCPGCACWIARLCTSQHLSWPMAKGPLRTAIFVSQTKKNHDLPAACRSFVHARLQGPAPQGCLP